MPLPPALAVSPFAARLFLRRALGFDEPHPSVGAALTYHGYIQIDPINVCGRMHDLILRNRVNGYREGDLMRHLHGVPEDATAPTRSAETRTGFEHHVPHSRVLAAFPLEAWPHLLGAMRSWSRMHGPWAGKLTPREKVLAARLLAELEARGPLGSEDFDDDRRARKVWGEARLAKATLQKLFFHGRILIAQRFNNRRRYDLPERVLPAAVLALPEPPARESERWRVVLTLRQRRLVTLKRDEVALVDDLVQPVSITGCPRLYCLRGDAPLLESIHAVTERRPPGSAPVPPQAFHLLAPLDPLIYDRRVTAALWGFEYTWEVYTPAVKRVRGYYALPVLAGTEIIGHVDPKADRAQRRLVVVSRRIRRGHALTPALHDFARWLGLRAR